MAALEGLRRLGCGLRGYRVRETRAGAAWLNGPPSSTDRVTDLVLENFSFSYGPITPCCPQPLVLREL